MLVPGPLQELFGADDTAVGGDEDLPSLGLGSFSPVITGWLTWLLHRAWEASDPEPSEKRDFAEQSVAEVLDEPLTVGRLHALLGAAE